MLASESVKIRTVKQIITTYEEKVLCNHETDTTELAPCTHEEANSRMILHLEHMVNSGCTKIMLKTVDTDVVVLVVAAVLKNGLW